MDTQIDMGAQANIGSKELLNDIIKLRISERLPVVQLVHSAYLVATVWDAHSKVLTAPLPPKLLYLVALPI